MTDPLATLYQQNATYQPHHDGTFWILGDAEGWGLACDGPVYQIWSAFDGRPAEQVIPAASTELGVPAAFVESTAKVLARAGMLLPSTPLPPLRHEPSYDVSDLSPFPLVSIIILSSRQARVHLETCLPSVLAQTYPNLQIILVDNQTTDDSVAFTKQNFPQVEILSTPEPLGFGAANNYAMKRARGDLFFLVNEDTEMEPDCIAQSVRAMTSSDRIACVAPKMKLFYMRSFFNSMGLSTHSDGNSHDNFIGYLDVGQFDDIHQVFTVCMGAAMLRRSVVEEIGYLDEKYFVFFEDSDWSFRARLCGYDLVTAPKSIVYHKFNATFSILASTFKLGLVVHNRLRFAWKNFDLKRTVKFMWLYLRGDFGGYLWARNQGKDDAAATYLKSYLRWLRSLPEVTAARWRTRRLRRSPFTDDAAFALVAHIPRPAMYGRYPVISTPFIRDHYMHLDIFAPESPAATQDPAPVSAPLASSPSSLVKKSWRVLRENGFRGLTQEMRKYFVWRIMPKERPEAH